MRYGSVDLYATCGNLGSETSAATECQWTGRDVIAIDRLIDQQQVLLRRRPKLTNNCFSVTKFHI